MTIAARILSSSRWYWPRFSRKKLSASHGQCYDQMNKNSPSFAGVGVLEGPMYAVGGHDGWSYLNTVERWDPQSRMWSYVAPLSTPRCTAGVTVLHNK